jgi:hypothetical protein
MSGYQGASPNETVQDEPISEDIKTENQKRYLESTRKRVSLEKIVQLTDSGILDSVKLMHETVKNDKANLNARVVCANSLIGLNLKAKKQLEEAKMSEQAYRHKELVIQVEAEKLTQLRQRDMAESSGYVSGTQVGVLDVNFVENPEYADVPVDPSLADDYVPDANEGLGEETFKV